ncbi:MAG: hypothetical protein J5858_11070 [Lentisphaeria bacterium]|nr:hypothetical protein [Lentisphaeria bacterium]
MKPDDEKETNRGKVFLLQGMMIVPYLLCAFYFLYAAWRYASVRENGDYASLFYLIHGPIHEIGHFAFSMRIFPEILHVAAGTLFQWLAPIAAGIQFIRIRSYPALAVCLGWLGLAMFDTAVYMRDARVLKLQLTAPFSGGGEVIHDWFYLFNRTGTLEYAWKIADFTAFCAWVCIIGSVLWILFMTGRGLFEQFRPKEF